MIDVSNDQPDIRMTPIPRLAQGAKWRVEAMRSYSSDLFLWFTRGQGRIVISGITRGYGAHNAIFIPAGTMHGFEVSPQVFGTAVFFPKRIGLTLPQDALHLRIRDAMHQAELTGLLENLQREVEGSKPFREKAVQNHAGLLAVWLERQTLLSENTEKSPDRARRLVARFTELIEHDFHSGKSVSDYAQALGVTPTHLSRVCNKACGRPASALLSDRIIYEARRLLAESRDPINVVASKLGFTSAAYFTRAFQHHTGQTPSAFRRAN